LFGRGIADQSRFRDKVIADGDFESDVTLMTGELGRMLADLVDASGGERPETHQRT
jgi:DNA recombination-dependent growth factor C